MNWLKYGKASVGLNVSGWKEVESGVPLVLIWEPLIHNLV